jgi:hypothetical protein
MLESSDPIVFLPLDQVNKKRPNPGESIIRIDIFFDDVKHKVIQPAKGPDGDGQQKSGSEIWAVEQYRNGGNRSGDQEKKALEINQIRVF